MYTPRLRRSAPQRPREKRSKHGGEREGTREWLGQRTFSGEKPSRCMPKGRLSGFSRRFWQENEHMYAVSPKHGEKPSRCVRIDRRNGKRAYICSVFRQNKVGFSSRTLCSRCLSANRQNPQRRGAAGGPKVGQSERTRRGGFMRLVVARRAL